MDKESRKAGMNINQTIHGFFEAQANRLPENGAVICDGQSLTYREFNERANQMAHYLREMGVNQPDTQIALCLERSIDLLCIILAILKAGGAYVPLDHSHPESRLLRMLNENKTPILITRKHLTSKFDGYTGHLVTLDESENLFLNYPSHNLEPIAQSDHLAYIIYTSGSTGTPKGVLIEHQSVINYCQWFAEYSACQANQRLDFSSNHVFDMVVTISIVPLMLGLTVVICYDDEVKKNVRHYLNYLEYHEVNTIKVTPSYFKILLYEIKSRFVELPHLRSIIIGGENLPAEDCRAWLSLYPAHVLHNEYGPTEATVGVSQYKVTHADMNQLGLSAPIGKPGPNIECYILDPTKQTLVTDGEIGELYIGGICLARGYLNQIEMTQQRFIPHPFLDKPNARLYKTGDLCRRLPDGSIEYIGRIDHQLKIRGFRIEPGEIEQALIEHPSVKDAIVLAQEDEAHDKRLIAYYITEGKTSNAQTRLLRSYLEQHLPEYMIPSALISVDSFPMNANGKLDREALPLPALTMKRHYLEPETELEKILADIWIEELGATLIGTEDNFFELGGHSLSAARIISKINSALEKDITLQDFYLAATIKKLADIVEQAKNVQTISLDHSLNDSRALLPLSDFQLILWLAYTFEPKASNLNIFSRKRVKGHLDAELLSKAFNMILKVHEVLSYQIVRFRPAQRAQSGLSFEMVQCDLSLSSETELENTLNSSIDELLYWSWRKKRTLLQARLFYLPDMNSEIQLCIPHIISDDVSPEILFNDLSMFYQQLVDKTVSGSIHPDARYRDYLHQEQHYSLGAMNRDIVFWDEYLKEACLFSFPPEYIIKNMVSTHQPYSSYIPIPGKKLRKLQEFCSENQVSINDGLCAILGLSLVHCCGEYFQGTHKIFMNLIKSTRDQHWYDKTIGCFLRLEPIKLELTRASTLKELAHLAHQSIIETSPYRRCFGLVKLASVSAFRRKRKVVSNYLLSLFSYVYTFVFRGPKINQKVLQLCGRLALFERNNDFLININVWNNFIAHEEGERQERLFGMRLQKTALYQYDLLKINNILEVCFLRDENIPYIVISANLKSAFRERIGKEMIRILDKETQSVVL